MTTTRKGLISDKGCGDAKLLSERGWSILDEEVSLPVAVLSQSALDNNAKWMQTFSERAGVMLAPHGKNINGATTVSTTDCIRVLGDQLSNGSSGDLGVPTRY